MPHRYSKITGCTQIANFFLVCSPPCLKKASDRPGQHLLPHKPEDPPAAILAHEHHQVSPGSDSPGVK